MAGLISQKKGFYSFMVSENKYILTLKEKKFSDLYLQFNGNGTRAAFETYNCKNARVAAAVASENLTKPNIIAYLNFKLEEYGFNEENVKKQHLFILNQFADLSAKNKAIDMYYRVTNRYKETQVSVSIFAGWTPTELQDYALQGLAPERFKR